MARPTARGGGLLFVAAVTYLAARLVGTWELYLLAFAFLAAVLLSWVLVQVSGRRLTAARTVTPGRPLAGDRLTTSLHVKNGSVLPGLQVTVHDVAGGLSGGADETHVESLGPFEERVVAAGPWRARRGVHHLPDLSIEAADPLGLVRTRRRLGEALDVTVYPRLVRLPSCALLSDRGARRDAGRRVLPALGGSEFRGVRPHRPGEPLSHIDWKATARTGSLMLREMDDPTSGDVTVLLDASADAVVGDPPDTSFELAVQAAGSVADFALREGSEVALLLPDIEWRRLVFSPDGDGRHGLREALARARPSASWRLGASLRALLANGAELARMHTVTLVVLSLDLELMHACLALKEEGLQTSLIHVSGASFAPGAASPALDVESRRLLLSLASAGVPAMTLERFDDLGAALSLHRTAHRHALAR
jgi:uncharacterized protein (DUF58 family)